jgi:hypothetical protein
MPVGRYRIANPTIAVIVEHGAHVAHTIPAGAIVTIESGGFDGKTAMMFTQDLRSRAVAID